MARTKEIAPKRHRARQAIVVFQSLQQRLDNRVAALHQFLHARIIRQRHAARLTVLARIDVLQFVYQRRDVALWQRRNRQRRLRFGDATFTIFQQSGQLFEKWQIRRVGVMHRAIGVRFEITFSRFGFDQRLNLRQQARIGQPPKYHRRARGRKRRAQKRSTPNRWPVSNTDRHCNRVAAAGFSGRIRPFPNATAAPFSTAPPSLHSLTQLRRNSCP